MKKLLSIIILLNFTLVLYSQTWTQYTMDDGLSSDDIRAIKIDTNDFYFGSFDQGVSIFDGLNWSYITTDDGLVANSVSVISSDLNNNIWIGTSQGISKIRSNVISNYYHSELNLINDITYDSSNVWFGTRSGAIKFDGEDWERIGLDDELISHYVTSIAIDNSETIWFGSLYSGLSLLSHSDWSYMDEEEGLIDNHINDIEVAQNGDLLFATDNGISRYDGNNWIHYSVSDGLAHKYVHNLKIDKYGNIWAGTFDGLSRFNGEIWETYKPPIGLSNLYVNDFDFDNDGNIWVAALGRSVYKLELTESNSIHSLSKPQIEAYPNPATHNIYIESDSTIDLVELFDYTGKVLFSTKEKTIDISKQPAGLYFISITSGHSKTVKKIVKN